MLSQKLVFAAVTVIIEPVSDKHTRTDRRLYDN